MYKTLMGSETNIPPSEERKYNIYAADNAINKKTLTVYRRTGGINTLPQDRVYQMEEEDGNLDMAMDDYNSGNLSECIEWAKEMKYVYLRVVDRIMDEDYTIKL